MFKVNREKCTGCGICLNACPVRAISMSDGKAQIEKEKCENCGVCVSVCPAGAIYSDSDTEARIRRKFSSSQVPTSPGTGAGGGMGRGLGRGMGRGLGRGPRDGRGGGRGGGGRRW
ncbi:4Fe-4S binding protein [candidate division WOR-3 bacterium]|nr:4Fe-4S binding protein [candidate division WOR-3 bacterium]